MIRYLRLNRQGRVTLEQLEQLRVGVNTSNKVRSTRDTKLIKVREMLDLWDTCKSHDNLLYCWCGLNTRARVLR